MLVGAVVVFFVRHRIYNIIILGGFDIRVFGIPKYI